MPTPRYHGGAALQHFPLNVPAFKGLNKQARGAVLGPEWATRMENTVLDSSNRVATRKGWKPRTTGTAAAGNFTQMIELDVSGSPHLIAVADDSKVYKSTDGGDNWSDVTGTATITDTNMQLQIFNDKLLGFQSSGTIIQYTGTTCSNLGATSEPQGGVGLAAFGRLWVKSGPQTLKYCALLDETDWTGSDAGTYDLTSVWQGQDEITAIAEFNGSLVIFSNKNVIVYTDGSGSALGLDPITAYVADTINGIGCIARDSVVPVKGDLWFLDDTGIHNLGRLISERSNPLNNVSRNVQDELRGYIEITDMTKVRAIYSPRDRFYLLSLPLGSGSTENGVVFCFDTRGTLEDGAYRCSGIWNGMVPTAMIVEAANLYLVSSIRVHTGEIGAYEAYYLDNMETYVMEYESGWTDLNTTDLKILKRISGLLFIQAATTVVYKWAFDFVENFSTASVIYPGASGVAEYGTSEYNVAEWGGGVNLREKRVGGRGTGDYIKIGMTIDVDGDEVSCQQINLYAKQGRIK